MVDGPDPNAHDPNDKWWVSGWTVQQPYTPISSTPSESTPYPADIPMVNIVATYMDDQGEPVNSRILVRPNATYRDSDSGTTVLPRIRPYSIKQGKLDIELPSSDSSALEAVFTYTVREAFAGGRQFAISVPSAKSGQGPVELHSLMVDDSNVIPIDSMPPAYGWQVPSS
jgi:hypothetical protein